MERKQLSIQNLLQNGLAQFLIGSSQFLVETFKVMTFKRGHCLCVSRHWTGAEHSKGSNESHGKVELVIWDILELVLVPSMGVSLPIRPSEGSCTDYRWVRWLSRWGDLPPLTLNQGIIASYKNALISAIGPLGYKKGCSGRAVTQGKGVSFWQMGTSERKSQPVPTNKNLIFLVLVVMWKCWYLFPVFWTVVSDICIVKSVQ